MKKKDFIPGLRFRFLAALVDLSLVIGATFLLSLVPFVRDVLYKVGEDSLIGIYIVIAYFTLFNSSLTQGQSIGKRIMRLQVVKKDGVYLSLPYSLFRSLLDFYLFLPVVFFIHIIHLTYNNLIDQLFYIGVYLGLITANAVLVAFHPHHKGLADIIGGTLVVRKNKYRTTVVSSLNRFGKANKAYILAGATAASFFFIGWSSSFILTKILSGSQDVLTSYVPPTLASQLLDDDEMLRYNTEMVKNKIRETTSFTNIALHPIYSWSMDPETEKVKKATSLNILGFMGKQNFENINSVNRDINTIVDIIINDYGYLNHIDYINIVPRSGFNIGIISSYRKNIRQFNVQGIPIEQLGHSPIPPKEMLSLKELGKVTLASFSSGVNNTIEETVE